MGIFSAIGGFISGCVGAVANVCSSIGGAVASGISVLVATIAPHLATIVQIVTTIAQVLGILNKDDNPEDLGEAMRKSDKKPEDFDSINDYIAHLREEIKSGKIVLDEDKTDLQKNIDTALGAGLSIKAIDEKYNLQTSPEFWVFGAKKFEKGKLNTDEIHSMLKTASDKKINPTDMANYVEHKELSSGVQKSEISSALKESLQEANPTLSKEEITEKFNTLIRDS